MRTEQASGAGKFSNLRKEKDTFLKRLEDREDEYQRINLENSELKHKLSVADDKIYSMQTTLEQSTA